MVKAAFESIDLEQHFGSHPWLGVVDYICFHPLERASLDQVAGIAKSLAVDVGSSLQVTTFLYGAAHELGGHSIQSEEDWDTSGQILETNGLGDQNLSPCQLNQMKVHLK